MAFNGTVSVLTVRPPIEALDRRKIDAEPALRAAQLSRGSLATIDHRLHYRTLSLLWAEAARAAHDRAFGLRVAQALPPGAYDLFDFLFSVSTTVGEGLAEISRYVRLIYDRSNLHLEIEPRHARLVRSVESPAPQYDEFTMALILVRSRQSSGSHWAPERMAFQHPSSGADSALARFFGCPIVYGAAETEMRFALPILKLPQKHADSRLLALLERYADSLITALPDQAGWVESVSAAITRQIARGRPSLPSTAAAVHYPPRTLQRRLAEKGVSHSVLVDRIRRDLALKYIDDPRLSIGEIAYLLHFSESPSFHRAFKRWTGEAPAEYRRHLFEHGSAQKRA